MKKSKDIKSAVSFNKVTKTIGSNNLVERITFDIGEGRIAGIVGENTSGKTTISRLISGTIKHSDGAIRINNELVKMNSSYDAWKLGIGSVPSDYFLVNTFTVLENITMNVEDRIGTIWINNLFARDKIDQIFERLNFEIEMDMFASELTIFERLMVNIVKVIYRSARILVFDDPLKYLTHSEKEYITKIFKSLAKEGRTIIIATDSLIRVSNFANDIIGIKDGKVLFAEEFKPSKMSAYRTKIYGKEKKAGQTIEKKKNSQKTPVLIADKLTALRNDKDYLALDKFSLDINQGEIVSVYGPSDSGQIELMNLLTGFQAPISGKTSFEGIPDKTRLDKPKHKIRELKLKKTELKNQLTKDIKIKKNKNIRAKILEEIDEIEHKIKKYISKFDQLSTIYSGSNIELLALTPKERYRYGLSIVPSLESGIGYFNHLSVKENLIVSKYMSYRFSKFGFSRIKAINEFAEEVFKEFEFKKSITPDRPMHTLTPFEKYKVVLARELKKHYPLYIVDRPTLSIPETEKMKIHKMITKYRNQGMSFILFTHDIDEAVKLSDRIFLIQDGKNLDELKGARISRNTINKMLADENVPDATGEVRIDSIFKVETETQHDKDIEEEQHESELDLIGRVLNTRKYQKKMKEAEKRKQIEAIKQKGIANAKRKADMAKLREQEKEKKKKTRAKKKTPTKKATVKKPAPKKAAPKKVAPKKKAQDKKAVDKKTPTKKPTPKK